VIECRDALEVIRVQDTPDGLFFVDPPYVHNTRDKQTRYRHELDDARHVELLTALKGCKGKVMISGYASDLYDDLLTGWQRLSRKHYAATGTIVAQKCSGLSRIDVASQPLCKRIARTARLRLALASHSALLRMS
jgi:DNA adenine methylase